MYSHKESSFFQNLIELVWKSTESDNSGIGRLLVERNGQKQRKDKGFESHWLLDMNAYEHKGRLLLKLEIIRKQLCSSAS